MKDMICCFTGHREIPADQCDAIAARLNETVRELAAQGGVCFRAGGALGFDTLAAQAVLRLRDEFPQIKLVLMLPYMEQARSWSASDQQIYEQIKERADEVIYTSQHYTRGCMHKRNRSLVDGSDLCICYLTKASGGTAYTVRYARSKGLDIINLAGPLSLGARSGASGMPRPTKERVL